LPKNLTASHKVPFHFLLGCCGLDFATASAEANFCWPIAWPCRNGGRVGSVSRCRWWAATTIFTGSACV